MNSFRLFELAKKSLFSPRFLSFFLSVASLCNSKKQSIEKKITDFRFNPKSLNEFNIKIQAPFSLKIRFSLCGFYLIVNDVFVTT